MKVWRVWVPSYFDRWQSSRYFSEIAMVTAADLVFAVAVGVIGQGVLSLAARWPRFQKALWCGFVGLCFLSVFYAAFSMRLYDVLRTPLTFALLSLGSDVGNMQSSLGAFLTRGLLGALIGIPVAYLVLTLVTEAFFRFKRRNLVRAGQVIGLGVIAWACVVAHQWVESPWGRRYNMPKLWSNAHYVLISSSISELLGRSTPAFTRDFPQEYLSDFDPTGERRSGAITPGIARGPKNAIIVVGESVSAFYLSLYGSKMETWPRMEAEAASSLVFRNFHAHIENTSDALFSMTLSKYPPLTWREATVQAPRALGSSAAAVLHEHAYRTAFISAGDNRYAKQSEFLADRGYDVVWDDRDSGCEKAFSWGVEDKCMVDMVFKFIDQDRSKPFYVFSWNQGTHHPFFTPPDVEKIDYVRDDKSLGDIPLELNAYLNSLREFDRQLGRLFDGLRERGLAEDTVVLVTGDHGQAFGAPHRSYYHSGQVYQEDVHVPLVIWSPALFKGGSLSETIGAQIDLAPTTLDLLGIASPSGWQGRSLMDTSIPHRAYVFGMRNDYIFGVRDGQFKYIFNSTQGTEELYDLGVDAAEQNNIAAFQTDRCRSLRQRLAAWVEHGKQRAVVK